MNTLLDEYTNFHSPGYVIEVYNQGEEKEIVYGNREVFPKVSPCNINTLYDIASLTKVYTATLVYMAYEEGKISLDSSIFSLDSNFKYLKNVKVLDLLSHNQEIWTDGYLGDAKDKEDFYKILYSAKVKSIFPTYVDVDYIILSTLLEKIYKKDYGRLLKEKIFEPLQLKMTTVNPSGDNIASNNYEELNGSVVDFIYPGLIHDTKARKAKELGIITGHSSIFTTGRELFVFLKTFLNYRLLKKETIELMLQHDNRNEKNLESLSKLSCQKDINLMYDEIIKKDPNFKAMHTYNYMGTRYLNWIHELNDVPDACSHNTIAFSGYTGPSFIIDFDKKVIVLV